MAGSRSTAARSRRSSRVADGPANDAPFRLIHDVAFGEGAEVVPQLHRLAAFIGVGDITTLLEDGAGGGACLGASIIGRC